LQPSRVTKFSIKGNRKKAATPCCLEGSKALALYSYYGVHRGNTSTENVGWTNRKSMGKSANGLHFTEMGDGASHVLKVLFGGVVKKV